MLTFQDGVLSRFVYIAGENHFCKMAFSPKCLPNWPKIFFLMVNLINNILIKICKPTNKK